MGDRKDGKDFVSPASIWTSCQRIGLEDCDGILAQIQGTYQGPHKPKVSPNFIPFFSSRIGNVYTGLDPESSAFSHNYWIPVFTGMTNHIDLPMKSLVITPMGLVNFCPLGLRGESKQFCALINESYSREEIGQ